MQRYSQVEVFTAQPSNKEKTLTRLSGNLYKSLKLAGTCNYRTALTWPTSLSQLQLMIWEIKSSLSMSTQTNECHWFNWSKSTRMTKSATFNSTQSSQQLRSYKKSCSTSSCNNAISMEVTSNWSSASLRFQVKQSNCSSKQKGKSQIATCMLLRIT